MDIKVRRDREMDIRHQIVLWVNEGVEAIRKRWPSFPAPSVSFDVKGRVAGVAYLNQHEVGFNLPLAEVNRDKFQDTVIHELAHLVQHRYYPRARQAHGREFRMIAKWLGGSGSTKAVGYAGVPDAPARSVTRYKAFCKCGTHFVTAGIFKKIEAGTKMSCMHCRVAVKIASTVAVKRKSTERGYEAF